MNFRCLLIGSTALLALTACGPRGDATASSHGKDAAAQLNQATGEGKGVETTARKTDDKVSGLDALLRDKPSYADARQALISAGWVPVPEPNNKESVIGSNWKEICAADPKQCEACDKLPELASVSADGQALMRFRDPDGGQVIAVHVMGMLSDYAVAGPDSRLSYMGWSKEDSNSKH